MMRSKLVYTFCIMMYVICIFSLIIEKSFSNVTIASYLYIVGFILNIVIHNIIYNHSKIKHCNRMLTFFNEFNNK